MYPVFYLLLTGVLLRYEGTVDMDGLLVFYEAQDPIINPNPTGMFGYSLAVSSNATAVLSGAPYLLGVGGAVVITPHGEDGTYDFVALLPYIGLGQYEQFGFAVALSGDGKGGTRINQAIAHGHIPIGLIIVER